MTILKNNNIKVITFYGIGIFCLVAFHFYQNEKDRKIETARLQNIQDLLNERISDRWRRSDSRDIWSKLFELNPSLVKPEEFDKLVSDIKETPIVLVK